MGNQEEIQEYESLASEVNQLNFVIEECNKIRINIEDEIPKLNLHQLQKVYLNNLLSNAQNKINGLWILKDLNNLEAQKDSASSVVESLKHQSSLRDDIIIQQKQLLKKHKIPSNISYEMLVRTESITSTIEEVDLESTDLPKLIQNPGDLHSIQYSISPMQKNISSSKGEDSVIFPNTNRNANRTGSANTQKSSHNSQVKVNVSSSNYIKHNPSAFSVNFGSSYDIRDDSMNLEDDRLANSNFKRQVSPNKRFNLDYRNGASQQNRYTYDVNRDHNDKKDSYLVKKLEDSIKKHQKGREDDGDQLKYGNDLPK